MCCDQVNRKKLQTTVTYFTVFSSVYFNFKVYLFYNIKSLKYYLVFLKYLIFFKKQKSAFIKQKKFIKHKL